VNAQPALAVQGEALLRLDSLSVDFLDRERRVRIIEDVDLTLARGETLGLVGESGSGKSTVANAILRLLPYRLRSILSGRVLFDGTDLLGLGEAALRSIRGKRIAMIPQDPVSSLNPLFTIGSQIAEALPRDAGAGRSRKARRAAVIELLRRVRIDSPELRVGQYPHELSGGMRQRVVGAIAMAGAPELLIADEPTTALDTTVQAQYLDLLAELKRATSMSMLFITHDLGVVARMADRIAVMYAGRIVECGPVRDIFRQPRHWYTQALLDSLPARADEAGRLASIEGAPPRPGQLQHGCRFAPRCPAAQARCLAEEPGQTSVGGEHSVRCWFPCAANGGATA